MVTIPFLALAQTPGLLSDLATKGTDCCHGDCSQKRCVVAMWGASAARALRSRGGNSSSLTSIGGFYFRKKCFLVAMVIFFLKI